MKRGKFEAPRRQSSPILVLFWVIFILFLISGSIFLLKSCSADRPEATTPTTQQTVAPTTAPATEPTEETTAPTEPATEPPTEPVTEPTTEPTAPEEEITEETDNTLGLSIAATAKAAIDKTYAQGGAGPDSFDTSGLITYCYGEHGISLPHNTGKLFAAGTEVAKEDLQPGDVVFFYLDTPDKAEYLGIYIGDSTFVAVSTSKNLVMERSMSSAYYTEHYVGARRYTPAA